MKTALIILLIWLVLVAFGYVIPAHGYDGDNPHVIMETMLDSYSYMSYAMFEEPFDFFEYSLYDQQWSFSCEKLGKMTSKGEISDDMCMKVFLYYWGL